MEFYIRKMLNESKFPHGPMSHALGHLWGEGQKYVPKKGLFLNSQFCLSHFCYEANVLSDLECFPHLYDIYIYISQINETIYRHTVTRILNAFVISLLIKFSN